MAKWEAYCASDEGDVYIGDEHDVIICEKCLPQYANLVAGSIGLYDVVKSLLFEFDEVTDDGQRKVEEVLREAREIIREIDRKEEGTNG